MLSAISNITRSTNIGVQLYNTHVDSRPDISFETGDKGALTVTIHTEDLEMKSVTQKDLLAYIDLFADPINMEKYRDGSVWSIDKTQKRLNTWEDRWQKGNAFSALAITNINEDDQFIGNIVAGFGEQCGSVEVARVLHHKHWGKRFGKQAAIALVNYYIPEARDRGYKLLFPSGTTPESVIATAREDNPASVKTWESLGMQRAAVEKYGSKRLVFSETIEKLDRRHLHQNSVPTSFA